MRLNRLPGVALQVVSGSAADFGHPYFCRQARYFSLFLAPPCRVPLGASWVPPGCLLGVSWVLPCLANREPLFGVSRWGHSSIDLECLGGVAVAADNPQIQIC